jgi:hypothetical protein
LSISNFIESIFNWNFSKLLGSTVYGCFWHVLSGVEENDVAMVLLDGAAEYSKFVGPAPMPTGRDHEISGKRSKERIILIT